MITFCPLSAAKVSGVTNSRAPRVITTWTVKSVLLQEAHQFRGLVGRDAAGYAESDSQCVIAISRAERGCFDENRSTNSE